MNNGNLINLRNRTQYDRKLIAKKGAVASHKKRRENKTLREELLFLLDSEDSENVTNRTKISLALLEQAKNGNVRAFETISNITDGKPVNALNKTIIDVPVIIDDI